MSTTRAPEAAPSAPSTPSARASAREALVPGSATCGFSVERTQTIAELDADAYVLRHEASGARLLYLAC